MAKEIYLVIEHVTHFDWERTEVIGASYNKLTCREIMNHAKLNFKSFDDEWAEYWIQAVPLASNIDEYLQGE